MQKTSNKIGSILIWSIFFSIIITVLFLGISTKINKKLRNSSEFLKEKQSQDSIQRKIKEKDFIDEDLTEKVKITFEKENNFSGSLEKEEKSEIYFSIPASITIKIKEGGPIKYKFRNNLGYTNSGIVKNSNLIEASSSGTLIIENLGGYTSFFIKSDGSFSPPEKRYKVIQKIGNREVEKTSGSIIK